MSAPPLLTALRHAYAEYRIRKNDKYKLTEEEISFIESMIKAMRASLRRR